MKEGQRRGVAKLYYIFFGITIIYLVFLEVYVPSSKLGSSAESSSSDFEDNNILKVNSSDISPVAAERLLGPQQPSEL